VNAQERYPDSGDQSIANGLVREERSTKGPDETSIILDDLEEEHVNVNERAVEEDAEGSKFCSLHGRKCDVYLLSLVASNVNIDHDNIQEITLDEDEDSDVFVKLASIPPVPSTLPGIPEVLHSTPSSSSQAVPTTSGSDSSAELLALFNSPSSTGE
jgi:hypothetical protein